ncbi:MAG: ComF family protein [Fimbriimonadales bacterium]|nr:ComF family protein [Fimbriimonadales bacterium]
MQPLDRIESLDDGPAVGAAFLYEGRAGQAVRRLKYERATALGAPMAALLAQAAGRMGLDRVDAIVPVPIHFLRRCSRGFNQSELLCEGFDRTKVRPDLLRRVRSTRPQVGLSREQRSRNLRGAFRASPAVEGLRVLLVDDVLTGGFTMRECASTLIAAGAAGVQGLVFCHERLASARGPVA